MAAALLTAVPHWALEPLRNVSTRGLDELRFRLEQTTAIANTAVCVQTRQAGKLVWLAPPWRPETPPRSDDAAVCAGHTKVQWCTSKRRAFGCPLLCTGGMLPCDPRHWWKNMGHSAESFEQSAMLHAVALQVGAGGTVCEVGFNAGHGAVALLHGLQTNLIEFDLMAMPYSQLSRFAVEKAYPGRMRFIVGRSQRTIPTYAALAAADPDRNPLCDAWIVDGDHGKRALLDMQVHRQGQGPLAHATYYVVILRLPSTSLTTASRL